MLIGRIVRAFPISSRIAKQASTGTVALHARSTDRMKQKVIILAGPTAVGKSDVAESFENGVLISADSVQVYRGVEIGANKPMMGTTERRRTVLIDMMVDQVYTTGDWHDDAMFVIQRLLNNNDSNHDKVRSEQRRDTILSSIQIALKEIPKEASPLPIIVGGTMMYLQWLCQGRPDVVRPTPTALARAKRDIEIEDWEQAKLFVASQGNAYQEQVASLFENDWYRLRRILEVAYTEQETGGATGSGVFTGIRSAGLSEALNLDVRCFFLCPDDRMAHTKLVDERCEQMIERGLIAETADLEVAGALPDMAKRAIGYRQTLDYLHRENPKDLDDDAFEQYLEDFCGATRRYAKRQMQWFRREKEFCFVPVSVSVNDKRERAIAVSKEIKRLVGLPRDAFDAELHDDTSTSSKTRQTNEEQGKGMKFYIHKTNRLRQGTEVRQAMIRLADEATQRVQAKRVRVS